MMWPPSLAAVLLVALASRGITRPAAAAPSSAAQQHGGAAGDATWQPERVAEPAFPFNTPAAQVTSAWLVCASSRQGSRVACCRRAVLSLHMDVAFRLCFTTFRR